MSKTMRTLLRASCCVAIAAATAQAQSVGNLASRPLSRDVATGYFNCTVQIVDPPVGTGAPRAFTDMVFEGTAGISDGQVRAGTFLGEGDGLEQKCEALSEQMRTAAQSLSCNPTLIRRREFVGGNFRETAWSFDMVCNDATNRVMNAIGTLLTAITTTPLASEETQTIVTADAIEHSESPVEVRERLGDSHLLRRRVLDR